MLRAKLGYTTPSKMATRASSASCLNNEASTSQSVISPAFLLSQRPWRSGTTSQRRGSCRSHFTILGSNSTLLSVQSPFTDVNYSCFLCALNLTQSLDEKWAFEPLPILDSRARGDLCVNIRMMNVYKTLIQIYYFKMIGYRKSFYLILYTTIQRSIE